MYDRAPAVDALVEALDNLEEMMKIILDKYEASLAKGDYVREEDEAPIDWDAVKAEGKRRKEAAAASAQMVD